MPVEGGEKWNDDEKTLMKVYGLTAEQMCWRRWKQSELKELFYQEYPENDTDCWITGEISVFDGGAIRRHMLNARAGTVEGNVEIWKDVIGGRKYVIACDVGGGHLKGDFSVATVWEARTNEHVATLRGRLAPDLFATEAMRLGRRYNDALAAIERNNHGHVVIKCFIDASYPNLYYHTDYDMTTGGIAATPGWITSGKTKPIMVDGFGAALRANDLTTHSVNLLNEAASYQYKAGTMEKLKTGAAPGEYDDELVSAMIALAVREHDPGALFDERYPIERYE